MQQFALNAATGVLGLSFQCRGSINCRWNSNLLKNNNK